MESCWVRTESEIVPRNWRIFPDCHSRSYCFCCCFRLGKKSLQAKSCIVLALAPIIARPEEFSTPHFPIIPSHARPSPVMPLLYSISTLTSNASIIDPINGEQESFTTLLVRIGRVPSLHSIMTVYYYHIDGNYLPFLSYWPLNFDTEVMEIVIDHQSRFPRQSLKSCRSSGMRNP